MLNVEKILIILILKYLEQKIIDYLCNQNVVFVKIKNQTSFVKCFVLSVKMNEIINKFLLAGDKFMPEMHLRQPGFTYSACGPFTKNKERIEKFMKTGNTDFIYKNELW